MPIQTSGADASIYRNIKGFNDYNAAAQQQGLQSALAAAQIQGALAKSQQAQYLDVDKLGKQSIIKKTMGYELTPEEDAAARYIDAKNAGFQFDPVTGGMIQKPTLQSSLGIQLGGGQKTAPVQTPVQTPTQKPAFNAPQDPNIEIDAGEYVDIPEKPQLGNAALDEQLAAAAGDPKLQQQIRRDASKISIKSGYAKDEKFGKVRSSLADLNRQSGLVQDNIGKALNLVRNSSTATGAGNFLLGKLPNSDARALNNYLTTIKANIGFDKLQNMRENSPTGGALGQVSDTENKLLQAVNGALDPLAADQLEDNLVIINDTYPQVMQERQDAFALDYGADALPKLSPLKTIGGQLEMPPEIQSTGAPKFEAEKYQKGKVYTSPTGQKAIYTGTGFRPTK